MCNKQLKMISNTNLPLLCQWIERPGTLYSSFMATRGTVKLLSRGSGEDLETVARGRRPRATVSKIFSTTEGQWFDCSPSSLEITVLLPNCFKSPKYCQQYAYARR